MKKGFFQSILIASFLVVFTFSSCDRDRYDGIPKTVAGTWTLSLFGTDGNANHILESGETAKAAVAGVDGVISYKGNGTFTLRSSSSGNVSGIWYERNGSVYTVSGGNTSSALVLSVTAKQLVVLNQDTTIQGHWCVYTR